MSDVVKKHETTSSQVPRLYRDLADWYPLLTPVGDYAEEAAFYLRLFEAHCRWPPRTLLDLGSGGGHNAAHLKATVACTLVDLEPAMLALYGSVPASRVAGADRGRRLRAARGPLRAQLVQRHRTRGVPRAVTCFQRRGLT